MFTKVSIAIAVLVATVSASDDFLGLERILQVQGTSFTTTCSADAGCAAGNCCADYRKSAAGAAFTNITKTCVNPILSGKIGRAHV